VIRKLRGYDTRDLPQEQKLKLEAMITRLTQNYKRVRDLLSLFTSQGMANRRASRR
jgi:hypothetical protein